MWFKPGDLNGTLLDASLGNKYFYAGFDNDEFRFYFESASDADAQIRYSTTLSSGWHHFAGIVRWNSNLHELYLDGSRVATSSTALDEKPSLGTIHIGDYYVTSPFSDFSGTIDELAIWGRALTLEEISALYNNGAGLKYPFTAGLECRVNAQSCSISITGGTVNTCSTEQLQYEYDATESVQNNVSGLQPNTVYNIVIENLTTGTTNVFTQTSNSTGVLQFSS